MPVDDARNDVLWELGQRLQLPVLATNNVHYADPGDADLAEVLAAISGRRSLEEGDGHRPATDERYLKSPEEMYRRFARYPGSVSRTGAHTLEKRGRDTPANKAGFASGSFKMISLATPQYSRGIE